ncbi:hypothetical protein AB5I41_11740 [Sphingomonas sp. MMS24-JH45]
MVAEPVMLPVRFTAARVTGVGDVAGGILRNLEAAGVLRVTSRLVTGDDIRLRSDKLAGHFNLQLDLRTGQFDIGLNGALGRASSPGSASSMCNPACASYRGGERARASSGGAARGCCGSTTPSSRASPAGSRGSSPGLTPDGVLHFRGLVLTAPDIRLTGDGYRRRDGTFHFEGSGRQASSAPSAS